MKEWQNAAGLLRAASDLIVERGWSQRPEESSLSVCAATALEAAFKEGRFSIADFQHAVNAFEATLDPSDPGSTKPADGVRYWGELLVKWNDTVGRTADNVIDALRRAGESAENRVSE